VGRIMSPRWTLYVFKVLWVWFHGVSFLEGSPVYVLRMVSNPYEGLDRKMVGVRTNDAPTWVDFSPCGDMHL
jgi:hypothetical protein